MSKHVTTNGEVQKFLEACAQKFFDEHAQGFLNMHRGTIIDSGLAHALRAHFVSSAVPRFMPHQFDVRVYIESQRPVDWENGVAKSIHQNRSNYGTGPRTNELTAKTLIALLINFLNYLYLPGDLGLRPKYFERLEQLY